MTSLTEQEEEPPDSSVASLDKSCTRSQRRAKYTRARLLEEARRLFCSQGFDKTSIEQITEAADLGKGTFYRHFSSKEELLLSLIKEVIENLKRGLRETAPNDLLEGLEHFIDSHIKTAEEYHESYYLFADWLWRTAGADEINDLFSVCWRNYLGAVEEYLRPLVNRELWPAGVVRSFSILVPLLLTVMLTRTPNEKYETAGRIKTFLVSVVQAWLNACNSPSIVEREEKAQIKEEGFP